MDHYNSKSRQCRPLSAALLAVAVILTAAAAQADHQRSGNHPPDSFEFKTLLQNSAFDDRNQAIDNFLARLDAIAQKHKASTPWKAPNPQKRKQRKVRYPDTASGALQSRGLIFRSRTGMSKKCDPAELQSCKPKKTKATLKQRFTSDINGPLEHMQAQLPAPFFSGEVLSPSLKFEVDYGWRDASGTRELIAKRSLSSSIESKGLEKRSQVRNYATLGDVIGLYPAVNWGNLAKDGAMPLAATCPIASTAIEVGNLVFSNGAECEASFTFWRKQTDDTPLASEFSFGCDAGPAFDAIHNDAKAIFAEMILDPAVNGCPDTKTAIARRCSASCPASGG